VLPLSFQDPKDYDLIEAPDRISIKTLAELAPGKPVQVVIHKPGGKSVTIHANHTLTEEQIGWFKAGSALNAVK
jgi:aconitate hydratase